MANSLQIAIKFGPELDAAKINTLVRTLREKVKGISAGVKAFDISSMAKSFREAEGLAAKVKAALKGGLGGGKVTLDATQANTALKGVAEQAHRARDALDDVSDGAGKAGGAFGQLSGLMKAGTFAAVGAGILKVGSSMVKANSEMEVFKTQLGTLLGSADKAEARLKELAKFGAETPFELPELIKAEKVLIGFGLQGDKALKLTGKTATELRTVIGDIAAGVGVPFDELAVTFGKFSAGATGEAISRLQELGIVTKEQLQGVGIQFDKAGSLVSPLPEAMAAAVKIAEQKFGGGMNALSQTFEGQLSTLKDTASGILRDLGKPLFESVKGALGEINKVLASPEFVAAMGNIGQAIGPIAEIITGTIAKLAPALISLLVPIADTVKTLLGPISQLIGGLTTSLGGFIQAIAGPLGTLLQSLAQSVVAIVGPLISALLPAVDSLLKALAPIIGVVAELLAIIVPLAVAFNPLLLVIQLLAQVFGAIVGAIAPVIQTFATIAVQILSQLQPAFAAITQVVSAFAGLFGEVLGFAVKSVLNLLIAVWSALGDLIAGFVGAKDAGDLFTQIMEGVKGAVKGVADFVLTLKDVLNGLRSAFLVVKEAVGAFIDAVSNFDIQGAINAFSGFGEKVSAAYDKGFNSRAESEKANRFVGNTIGFINQVTDFAKGVSEQAKGAGEATKKAGTATKKAAKEVETAWQVAQKAFQTYKTATDTEAATLSRAREALRIQERREKTVVDEVLAEKEKLNLAEQQLQKLKELTKFSQGEDGKISFGIQFKKGSDEEAQATALVNQALAAAQEQANKFNEIRLKLLPQISETDLATLGRERLTLEIELGLRPESDLESALQGDLNKLKGEAEAFAAERRQLLQQARQEGLISEAEYQQQLAVIQAGGLKEQLQFQNQIYQKQLDLREIAAKREEEFLEKKHKREHEVAEETARKQEKILSRVFKAAEKIGQKALDATSSHSLRQLEAQQKAGLISEEKFQADKAKLDERTANQREALAARLRGEELQAERETLLKKLELDRQQLSEKEKTLRASGKVKEANDLKDQLDGLDAEISKKGKTLSSIGEEIQGNMTDIFSNLFQGDAEAVKAPFRAGFQTLVGALKRLASSKIVEVLLGSISGLGGIPGLIASFAAKPIIEGLVNALLSPVFNSLLSFSTGGRVDRPTLALVGDASRLGGGNREWIFRDEQLRRIVAESSAATSGGMMSELRGIRNEIAGFAGRIHVVERDIGEASARHAARVNRRTIQRPR